MEQFEVGDIVRLRGCSGQQRIPLTDLYWKHTPEEISWFLRFMAEHRDLEFFQPNPNQAPWHIQCKLDNGVLINFWPHVCKAMIQDEPPVSVGVPAIEELIHEAKTYVDDFDVLE